MRLNCVIKTYYVQLVCYFRGRRRRIGVMALSIMTQQHGIINDALRCPLSPSLLADTALWHPAPAPLHPSSPSSSPLHLLIFGWLLCLPLAAVRAGRLWLSIFSTQISMVDCWVIPPPPRSIQTAPVVGRVNNDPVNARRWAERAWTAHRRRQFIVAWVLLMEYFFQQNRHGRLLGYTPPPTWFRWRCS